MAARAARSSASPPSVDVAHPEPRVPPAALDTTTLTLAQWAVCVIVGLLIVVEVRKLVIKTPLDEDPEAVAVASAVPAVA